MSAVNSSVSLSGRLLLTAVLAAAAASLCSAAEQSAPRKLLASSNSTSESRLVRRPPLLDLQLTADPIFCLHLDHSGKLTVETLQVMMALASSTTAALPSAVRSYSKLITCTNSLVLTVQYLYFATRKATPRPPRGGLPD